MRTILTAFVLHHVASWRRNRVQRWIACLAIVLPLVVTPQIHADQKNETREVKELVKTLEGETFWLKAGVVKIQLPLFRGIDATNVYPDANLSYRATLGVRQSQSQDAEDFAEEMRILAIKEDIPPKVRILKRGAEVRIRKIKIKDNEAKIELEKYGNTKHAVRLKFEDKHFTAAEFQSQFDVIFAKSEAELAGAKNTVEINVGMSTDEVIAVRGKPNSRINLGSKILLTYDDVKLIFLEDKLADAQ